MYGNTCGVVGLSCIPVEDRKLGEELSQRSRSGYLRPDEVHALAFSLIEKMSDMLIIPSIMLK